MKNSFLLFCFVLVLFGCRNSSQNKLSNAIESQIKSDTLSVDEFLGNPASLADQEVIVKGMVAHVCKHGGQKLFLLGTITDKFLRINTGKSITEFPVDLEGSTIEVKGVVTEFELDPPGRDSTNAPEGLESDTSRLEKAYHKDNFYVIVAESYKELE